MGGTVDHKPTQNERILRYIREYGSITSLEALRDLGVARLASRICDLKRLGYEFKDEFEPCKNRWGENCPVKRYYLCEVSNEL